MKIKTHYFISVLSFILINSIMIPNVFAKNTNDFTYDKNSTVYTQSTTNKVEYISSNYHIFLKSWLSIDSTSGKLYDVGSVSVGNRGNLPSKFKTPTVHRIAKQRESTYSIFVEAEVYTVDKSRNNLNISDIVSYTVNSPGPEY